MDIPIFGFVLSVVSDISINAYDINGWKLGLVGHSGYIVLPLDVYDISQLGGLILNVFELVVLLGQVKNDDIGFHCI